MIPNSETIARAKEILSTIESLQAELAAMFGEGAGGQRRGGRPAAAAKPQAAAEGGGRKKRRMSAEGRAAIIAAAKARWAKFRAEKEKKAAK